MMTRSLSHKITAISMAFLMLLASTGFSMDVHYCKDQLKGISLFGKAKSCHEKQETLPCHKTKKSSRHNENGISKAGKDNCCHNETLVIDKSDLDATSTSLSTVQNIQLDYIAAFIAVYVFNFNVQTEYQPYLHYKPPLPERDVQVLYQTFLI